MGEGKVKRWEITADLLNERPLFYVSWSNGQLYNMAQVLSLKQSLLLVGFDPRSFSFSKIFKRLRPLCFISFKNVIKLVSYIKIFWQICKNCRMAEIAGARNERKRG